MKKKSKKYYYIITETECVLCGRGKTTRERVYGKKPKDPWKTHIFEQYACGEHFI
jgi:hypothetical protein